MKRMIEPRLEVRQLAALVAYPRQQEFFGGIPDTDLEELARGMREGRVPPIEVLPENRAGIPTNTILRGHRRKAALELNGETQAEVLVRYDLADADALTIEREFLIDNHARRHADILTKARIALRLFEIEKRRRGKLSASEEAEGRDRVGKLIGMSGRNLQRYWALLRAPVEIQNAYRLRQLTLVPAARVAGLKAEVQAEIAARIRAGEDPAEVVAARLAEGAGQRRRAVDHLGRCLRGLVQALRHADQIDELRPDRLKYHLPKLRQVQEVVEEMIEAAAPPIEPAE